MYLAVLAAAASQGSRKASGTSQDRSARSTRFVVCVPAHDEESIIRQTVLALREQNYDQRAVEICVVADNCTDGTAAVAAEAGAQVLVRIDAADPGKGAALNWLADRLTLESSDVVVVIDADTVAHPDFLSALDEAFAAGAKVAQGHYGVQDPDTSPAVALRYAAIACRHHLRPLGRTNLGASSGLYGNGMAFRADVVWNRRWTNHLVEDAEFQMELLFDGLLVTYVPDAVVRAEMPVSFAAATSQNERWELGRLQLTRRYVPRLLARACFGGRAPRRAYLDAACDHLIPPLALQTVVNVAAAGTGTALLFVRGGLSSRLAALGGIGSCVLLAAHVFTGLHLVEAPPSVYRSLRSAPQAVVWKLGLLARIVRRPDHVTWTRTPRNEVVR
jgi:cellulose synthase/poly-beta-1,6-N-acetylglucosamine synthase-like glycosyltransferase